MTNPCNCGLDEDGNICLTQGNNFPPIVWQFLNQEGPEILFPLDGSVFHLEIAWPGGSLSKATDTDPEFTIDLPTSKVTWTPALADTRAIPVGTVAEYELERWIDGTQQTMIRARVSMAEGINHD